MIKSFLKKVFSSSSEPVKDEVREREPKEFLDPLSEERMNSVKQEYVEITITRDWLDRHNVKELSEIIGQLYEEAFQTATLYPKRVRIRLAEFFQNEMDAFLAKRLSKYLDQCEQEIIDLTFFLDKDDPLTADIYRTYLVPQQQMEGVHSFIRERCMMIYETSMGLSLDYRREIEQYFSFLGIAMGSSFFQEFETWKDQVLRLHQDQLGEQNQQSSGFFENTMLTISRQEVENENIQKIEGFINEALRSPETARLRKGKLLFSFHGFSEDEDLIDLMNRKEINAWASIVVERHPYIFYFLNDEEYPMTKFLTSLVVSTEVEDDAVYYNVEELGDFRDYVQDAIVKLSEWLKEDSNQNTACFQRQFG